MHRSCPAVCPSVSPFFYLSVVKMQKNAIFSNTKQSKATVSIDDLQEVLCKLNWAFQRTHYWIPTIQDGWDPPSWKSTWRHYVIFFCRGWSDLDKISQTGSGREWHVDSGDVWKWKPDVEFQYGGRLREFNGVSSQSHVSHCRVCHLVNSLSRFQSHMPHCRV